MNFHTERPKTPEEMITSMLKTKQTRITNLKLLSENSALEKGKKHNQGVLESVQLQQETENNINNQIESRKTKRATELFEQKCTIGKLTLLEQAKKTVMNKVLFEMVYDAYWLDSNIKETTIQETYNTYRQIVDVVTETCAKSKTPDIKKSKFMSSVEEVVSDICNKSVNRIIKESKETGEQDIKFNLTTEEESELDTKLSELGRDDIVELIKDKVLTVVQDEKESGKEKAEMLQEINKDTEDEEIQEDQDTSVSESITLGATIVSAAILGIGIACVVMSAKDKLEMKKSLKLYELHCNPKIKMSDLQPTLYELDKHLDITDKELTGLKKLLNKNSKRAKIWKDSNGNVVCVSVYNTETKVTPGIQATNDGVSPTINIARIPHFGYDVNPKYKEDALYLAAYMAFIDGYGNDNTRIFIKNMNKSFKKEMKDTKVKFFGKSLEFTNILEYISPNFVEYEAACKLLEECGLCDASTSTLCECATIEPNPENAINLLNEYNEILNHAKISVQLAPSENYSNTTKNVVTNAIIDQQKLCNENIKILENEVNKIQEPDIDKIVNEMKRQKYNRALNRTGAGTLFESLMVANTKKVSDEAVTEGISIEKNDIMNASLIESILQYTVLETLNTLKIYQFTANDINNLKIKNRLSV